MSSPASILIVEDTGSIAIVFQKWLKSIGLASEIVGTGQEGIDQIDTGNYKVVLLDLDLPDMNGLEILSRYETIDVDVTFVVITASGSIKVAVDAMRMGAYDFIIKPAAEERLLTTVRNALERESLQTAVKAIKKTTAKKGKFGFVGSSLVMNAVYRSIEAIAQSTASVFITGESGTGKEVCAQAIHDASQRAGCPFVPLNCAAIPKDLIESEIFGHVSGAFTGATSDRKGAAATANGGTLFLDEICEMDLNLQAKLLRFLQTGMIQKVGSDKSVKVDVRIVCATNRDPVVEVEEGNFREDLFYRLHVVPLHLPPLREREADVVEIAESFLKQISEEEGKSFSGFDEGAQTALLNHPWPGNVRELQNVVRNAVVLNDAEIVSADMLSIGNVPAGFKKSAAGSLSADPKGTMISVDLDQPFDQIEREIIETAIRHCGNSIPKASKMLDISPSTIYRKKEGWE
ncbi:MAG: sigma-54 dependent transcriptional regulator [Pseudomonadota bacterium]